jgi:hypothetical protein
MVLQVSRAKLTVLGRIHFSIHYPDLNFESRKIIWKTFFTRTLKQQGLEFNISEEDLDRLAKREMNGRQVSLFLISYTSCDYSFQIKNTVSNAQSIALETQSPLSVEHVDAVLEVVSDWNTAKAQQVESS